MCACMHVFIYEKNFAFITTAKASKGMYNHKFSNYLIALISVNIVHGTYDMH